jgi:hypothetical protein
METGHGNARKEVTDMSDHVLRIRLPDTDLLHLQRVKLLLRRAVFGGDMPTNERAISWLIGSCDVDLLEAEYAKIIEQQELDLDDALGQELTAALEAGRQPQADELNRLIAERKEMRKCQADSSKGAANG